MFSHHLSGMKESFNNLNFCQMLSSISTYFLSFVLQLLFLVSGSAKSVNENVSQIKVVIDPSHSSLTVICLSSSLAETRDVCVN